MEKELRKRLEEAARKEVPDILRINVNYVEAFITGFCFGGEWMFKECGGMTVLKEMRQTILAQCKEWMKENYHLFDHFDKDEVLADLEADMNKLWEGEK